MKARTMILGSMVILILLSSGKGTTSKNLDHGINIDQSSFENVILMIGDGMGFHHVKAASYVEYGVPDGLFMQSDDFLNLSITTYAANEERTDSAASASAFATGYKTNNGKLSVFPNGSYITPTILEYAQTLGKSTGVVTSTRYNHATPAAFVVHENSRNEYERIAENMLTKNVEVIMGGGEITLPSETYISDNGYTLVKDKTSLSSVSDTKVLGVFGREHIPYEQEMDYSVDTRLTDMVSKSLQLLGADEDGFFLVVEGGRIDHASHDRDLDKTTLETIQFDYAIKVAMDFTMANPGTLLIVAADHETGGLYFDNKGTLDADLPANYDTENEKRERRIERVNQLDAEIPTTSHTAVEVPFLVYGTEGQKLVNSNCEYSNANVFQVMKNAFDGIIPDNCPVYIEGYNDPDIDDYPGKFVRDNKPPSSNIEETVSPVLGVFATLVVLIVARRKFGY